MNTLRLREIKDHNQSNTAGKCEVRYKLRQMDPRAYIFPTVSIVSWHLSDSWEDDKQVSPGKNGQDVKTGTKRWTVGEENCKISIKEGQELTPSDEKKSCFTKQFS